MGICRLGSRGSCHDLSAQMVENAIRKARGSRIRRLVRDWESPVEAGIVHFEEQHFASAGIRRQQRVPIKFTQPNRDEVNPL